MRMLSSEPSIRMYNTTVRYFPIEGFARQTFLFGAGRADMSWTLWAPLYMTALQTSRQYWRSTMDLFGNVRVPDIRQLSPDMIDTPDYEWHNFTDVEDVSYSSMLGLSIVGVPEVGNSSFRLQSFYWAVECGEFNHKDFTETEYTQTPSFNLTLDWRGERPDKFGFTYRTRRVTEQNVTTAPPTPHANITGILYTSNCYASPLVVESEVGCEGRSCSVHAMRRLQQQDPYRVLSLYEGPVDYLGLILQYMPGADIGYNGEPTTRSSELVEQWISNPDLNQFDWVLSPVSTEWTVDQRWVNLAALTPAEFSRRLQIAMNTYWDASVGSMIRMGNFTMEQVETMGTENNFSWNSTEAKGVRYEGDQYVCDIAFASITMALSLALCVAAMISLILGVIIKAPDILGFVSTSARDNPYVQQHISSRSDGLQAARDLRDVRMRIGDVNEKGDVGHVAFTTTEQGPGRLSRKRLYD